MANKVRLGIVGLGAQGSMYARFIKTGMVPNMGIGAICDHDQAKAEIVEGEFPDVKFYSHYETMLDSGDVDAIVTCVPHYLHPEMGIAALQRGVHARSTSPSRTPNSSHSCWCSPATCSNGTPSTALPTPRCWRTSWTCWPDHRYPRARAAGPERCPE